MPDILDTLAGRTGGSLSHALFGRGRCLGRQQRRQHAGMCLGRGGGRAGTLSSSAKKIPNFARRTKKCAV